MEVTGDMIDGFLEAYRVFGDAGECFDKLSKEMNAADALLGLEHPEYYARVRGALCVIRSIRWRLDALEGSLNETLREEEE